jgi:hypothetical protein
MPVTKRREKIVIFRLTEQEHKQLKQLCVARGGRSLSEFSRVELLSPARYVDVAPLQELIMSLELRLLSLESQHNELLRQVKTLVSRGVAGPRLDPETLSS